MSSVYNTIQYLIEIKELSERILLRIYSEFNTIKLTEEEEKTLKCKEILQKILKEVKK